MRSINHQHASSFCKYDFELLYQVVHNVAIKHVQKQCINKKVKVLNVSNSIQYHGIVLPLITQSTSHKMSFITFVTTWKTLFKKIAIEDIPTDDTIQKSVDDT